MKLYTETTGAGRDLVMIHGWGMNSAVWSLVVERLAKQFRVTVIELPGHGKSEYDHTRSSLDDWTSACLDSAPDCATWIGWSLGGQVAQRAAMLSPHRVERLVLVASSPRFIQGESWPHAMNENTLTLFADTLAKNHRLTLERFLSLQVRGDEEARHTLRLLRHNMAERPEPNPSALEHGLDLLLKVDLRQQIAQINCPTLWLLGERDTLVPAAAGEMLKALQPAADVLTLRGCAHAPFLSHTAECLSALESFLGETGA